MFGIGETELVIIVVFAFLLFGPDKLPGMGRTLGRVLRQFREASDGFTEVVQTNIMDPASEELEKSPKQRKREAAELEADAAAAGTDASQEAAEAAPARRETFAERKARLLAERKAADAAAQAVATKDPAAQVATAGASSAANDSTGESSPADQAGPARQQAPSQASDEPKRTSAADLYALTSQKSSRTLAKEAAAQAPQPGEEDGEE